MQTLCLVNELINAFDVPDMPMSAYKFFRDANSELICLERILQSIRICVSQLFLISIEKKNDIYPQLKW